jgi:steroid delta-isomerase-like uncharacterized protein
MGTEENKAFVRRFFEEVINRGNLAAAADFMTADFVEHESLPVPGAGVEGFRQFFTMLRAAFPDFQVAVDDLIAEGDQVVARVTLRGTHRGPFLQVPPTGRQVAMDVIDVVRLADGKIAEHWGVADNLTLLRQVGAIGEPAQGPPAP